MNPNPAAYELRQIDASVTQMEAAHDRLLILATDQHTSLAQTQRIDRASRKLQRAITDLRTAERSARARVTGQEQAA
jgi:hypothetical protein